MISGGVTSWRGTELAASIQGATWQGIQRAALHLRTKMQLKIGKSGRVKGKGRKTIHVPSKPGEPPRKKTGALQASVLVQWLPAILEARIGVPTNTIYGFYLEVGTRTIAPRPWMAVTFFEERHIIQLLVIA